MRQRRNNGRNRTLILHRVHGGGIIVDGTCTFIVDDVRDGTPVGQVRASMFVPAGYVKLNGATVNRSNYPRLVALATKYSLWTSDTTSNPGLFGQGNGSTTMVLPNWTGRMAQFAATAGGAVAAGLPNITGGFSSSIRKVVNENMAEGGNGCCAWTTVNVQPYGLSGSVQNMAIATGINASLSNPIYSASTTVQPPAINTFAIMRY